MTTTRLIDVTVYDSTGVQVVDLSGGRYEIAKLEFSTVLPGGFGELRMQLTGAAAHLWKLRSGLKIIVRYQRETVWWGWIEDVQQRIMGMTTVATDVVALGPFQQLRQRLFSGTYSGVEGSAVLQDILLSSCPDISHDHTNIQSTAVPISVAFTNRPVAELVELVARTGNQSAQRMLFAIWEPSYHRANLGPTANLLSDPGLEQGTTYWAFSDNTDWQTAIYRSATHGARWDSGETGQVNYKGRATVSASQPYAVSYWVYHSAHSNLEVYSRVDWYTSSDTIISSSYSTHHFSSGTPGWVQYVDIFSAPATAATARPFVLAVVGSGTGRMIVVDDVMMYLAPTTTPIDDKPRPYLWALDTTMWDYLLRLDQVSMGVVQTETTRDLANYVVVRYGGSYTAAAEDSDSQALYRRRDLLVEAQSTGATEASMLRDTTLAYRKAPKRDIDWLTIPHGALSTAAGWPVAPIRLRAGHRIKLVSSQLTGIVLIKETRWQDGVVTALPERLKGIADLLAD